MTNNEIIQTIINEIERRIKIQDDWIAKGLQGENLAIAVREELKQLLSTIPTIESEKPIEQEKLEEALDKWRHDHFHGKRDDHFSGEYLERKSQLDLAYHFAKWGAEHLANERKMTRDVEDVAAEKAREYAMSLPGGERTTAVGSTYSESGYYHGFVDGFKFKSDEKSFIENLNEAAEEESTWAFPEPTAQGYAKRLFFKSGFKRGAKWQKNALLGWAKEKVAMYERKMQEFEQGSEYEVDAYRQIVEKLNEL